MRQSLAAAANQVGSGARQEDRDLQSGVSPPFAMAEATDESSEFVPLMIMTTSLPVAACIVVAPSCSGFEADAMLQRPLSVGRIADVVAVARGACPPAGVRSRKSRPC